jgi:hypothetical protein
MPRKALRHPQERLANAEQMFVSPDEKSIRRGRRSVPRTEACRPCLLWTPQAPDAPRQGVVLDLNPYGLRVRMLDHFAEGTELMVQMMRDEEFRFPLSPPIRTRVMRTANGTAGFVDHGLKVLLAEIKRAEEIRPVEIKRPRTRRYTPVRMHTADQYGVDRGVRRSGRNRG